MHTGGWLLCHNESAECLGKHVILVVFGCGSYIHFFVHRIKRRGTRKRDIHMSARK